VITAPSQLTALTRTRGPGTSQRLSDLLDHYRSPGHPVFVSASALRHAGNSDPVLYTAWRDVLPPRQAAGTEWFADLVLYQPGELPGGELHRSTGHWNAPAQLEVFQTVSGRTLMITARRDSSGAPVLRYQECGPGSLAAVPFGAWHLTLVLDGPAAVFNLYCDLPGAGPAGAPAAAAARQAATSGQAKYRTGPAVEITARRAGHGFTLTGSARGLQTWGSGKPIGEPGWLRDTIGDASLSGFFAAAEPGALSALADQARRSLPAASRQEVR
jgi:hypothetical protein